jgi:hypothetical protein
VTHQHPCFPPQSKLLTLHHVLADWTNAGVSICTCGRRSFVLAAKDECHVGRATTGTEMASGELAALRKTLEAEYKSNPEAKRIALELEPVLHRAMVALSKAAMAAGAVPVAEEDAGDPSAPAPRPPQRPAPVDFCVPQGPPFSGLEWLARWLLRNGHVSPAGP